MENRAIRSFGWVVGLPAVLLGVSMVVLYLLVGPEILSDKNLWLLIASFFLFVGVVVWLTNLVAERMFAKAEDAPEHWEIVRAEGKWRYVLTLFGQISVPIVLTLTLAFFLIAPDPTGATNPLLALILLVLLTIVGAFVFALEMWKTREYESNKNAKHEDTTL